MKLCPLKFNAPLEGCDGLMDMLNSENEGNAAAARKILQCNKTECAWWNDTMAGCSMNAIGDTLEGINIGIESLLRRTP